jgi:hypothetical protein
MRYLVEFNENWADEFNVHGLAIMTKDQYDLMLKHAGSVSYYFGTNEGWDDEDFTNSFTIRSADEDAICAIETMLNFYEYGSTFKTWGNFPDIMNNLYESRFGDEYRVDPSDDVYEAYHYDELIGTANTATDAYEFAS